MKTSGLAVTVLTLVGTLALMDLSGAHQLSAQQAVNTQVSMLHVDHARTDDAVTARLTNSVSAASSSSAASSTQQGRAVHRCTASQGASKVRTVEYCFGTPVVEIDYN